MPSIPSMPVPEADETYPRPVGEAAQALVWAQWPNLTDGHFKALIAQQQKNADLCSDHTDATMRDAQTQADLLVGEAGDANQQLLLKMATHAADGKAHFESKVSAAKQYWAITNGVKIDLTRIADAAQKEWDTAKTVPGGTAVVTATYAPEVETIIDGALTDIAKVPAPTPLPAPPTGNGSNVDALDNKTKKKEGDGDKEHEKADSKKKMAKPSDENDHHLPGRDKPYVNTENPGASADGQPGATQLPDSAGDNAGSVPGVDARPTMPTIGDTGQPGRQLPSMPSLPASPLGSGPGSSSGPGSGLGGLGSGGNSLASAFKPPATPSLPASSVGTSPASAFPKVPPPDSFVSGLSNAGSSFQSGVASGMGASGAVPSSAQYAQPLAPMPVQQPVVASPSGFSGPAGAGAISAADGGSVAGGGTHGAPVGGGTPMGGGGMMPPPAAAGGGQPLAPYSPPASSAPGGAPVSSGPASTAGAAPAAPAAAPGGAGSPAVVAGNSSSAAAGATLASTTEANPDIAMATRVLAGLVRGSQPVGEVLQSPVSWAVAVLRTPTGPQTVVASSVGGGGYVPVTVFLPVTVRLAVADSALPIGWAGEWMGSQQPSAILAAHFERLSEVVSGVRVSAIVTSEMWPKRPRCGGDFVAVRQIDILQALAEPPVLDAGHQHRLAATDLALTSRLASLGRSFTPDVAQRATAELAVRLTESVLRAASEPDETGQRLCGPAEEKLWQAIRSNTIGESDWSAWASGLDTAVQVPEMHAPRDPGSSAESVNARMWYRHYYRAGRVAELLSCWDSRRPSMGVWDVAYCGVAAGFGSEVASAVAEVEHEQRMRQS